LDPFFGVGNFQSDVERRVFDIAKLALANLSISVTSNEFLFSIFEGDLVLRVPIANETSSIQSNSSNLIINIEVDGVHHRREKKKRFCNLRDKYLKSQGVVIERIEANKLRRMRDKEVREWIEERVANAQQTIVTYWK
jgi:hypothetical protein